MLKKIALLLLTVSLLLSGLLSAQAAALEEADTYARLQKHLHRRLNSESGAMPLADLSAAFGAMNQYMKSAQYAYYTAILLDAEAGDYSRLALYTRLLRADEDFCALLAEEGFPSVDKVEAYALGRQAEEAGDWNAAVGYYEQSISVLDSLTRAMRLLTATPTPTATPKPTATPTPTPKATPTPQKMSIGDYKITAYHDGTCEITDYTGNAATLAIPSQIGGYRVTSIGSNAFFECITLTYVSVPDTVTIIEDWAFANCDALTGITISKSAITIGDSCFSACGSLTSIVLPESVASIGNYAFSWCGSLTSITIPNSVISIGTNPFRNCGNLTHIQVSSSHPKLAVIDGVLFDKKENKLISYPYAYPKEHYTIPYGTKSIGAHSFYDCDFLTSINIPDSVIRIDGNPFTCCYNLTHIQVSPFHPVLAVVDGVLFDTKEKRLITYPLGRTVEQYNIPYGTKSIGEDAFTGCGDMNSITIPDSVTYIEDSAFRNYRGLPPVLRVPANSYAERYAIDIGFPYTTY